MDYLRVVLSCLFPLHYCLAPARAAELEEHLLSGKLSEYAVIVPFSTDCQGRFLSHMVSGSVVSGSTETSHPSTLLSALHRVARSTLEEPLHQGRAGNRLLYFNVTVFGKELHLRLKPNHRLVLPGASAEWQEDFQELFQEPLQQECIFTGDISDMPGATVAISNCDGLQTAVPGVPRNWLSA